MKHKEFCGIDASKNRIQCPCCVKKYSRRDRLKEHMGKVHGKDSFDLYYLGAAAGANSEILVASKVFF